MKRIYLMLCWYFIIFPSTVFADIPKPPGGIGGADTGDFGKVIPAILKQYAPTIVNVMYFICGIAIVGTLIYKYLEAKEQNKWGGFTAALIVGVIVFVIVIIFLNLIKGAVT